jgi:hypothetical protein
VPAILAHHARFSDCQCRIIVYQSSARNTFKHWLERFDTRHLEQAVSEVFTLQCALGWNYLQSQMLPTLQ